MQYDFITKDGESKSMVIQKVPKILASGNLRVNDTKTEVITLKRSNNDTERWWKIKKLGSLLGDKEDIKNRISIREIKSETDLHNIGIKARNKKHWKVVVKQVVQAAYSNTSIRQQQWKVVHNVHWCGGEQAEVIVVINIRLVRLSPWEWPKFGRGTAKSVKKRNRIKAKVGKFSVKLKMRHIFGKMLQIVVLLKNDHLVEENKKTD